LDRTPSPGLPGSGGEGQVEGTARAAGWKVAILFGNAPNGGSSSSVEITMNDGWQQGFPTMYGQQGSDSPNLPNTTVPFVANQFMEITERVEVRGASNAPQSHVEWWVNGVKAGDWGTAKIAWGGGDGDGLGQIMLTPVHTRKDPTQVHAEGYMWFDDLIVSTKPIAMIVPPSGRASRPPSKPGKK